MEDRDAKREALKKEAQEILRGSGGEPRDLLARAEELKSLNEFGYARRLLTRARETRVHEAKLRLKLAQRHALCTYKDPDQPMHEKLARALEILQEVEDLRTTRDQETLGLTGAIYKRMWQINTDKGHLERSLSYYRRGWEVGPETDFGYTSINAAYVLDMLANLEEGEAAETGTESPTALARREQAREIRQKLVMVLPGLPSREGNAWLDDEWWFAVTVAEACFGLGDYPNASVWLRRAKRLIHKTPPWEIETTALQLASLAQLQSRGDDAVLLEQTEAWRVLEEFLDQRADAVRTAFAGKLGLGLSGGGFRASLYHIGVLARLAELDLLRHVHVLSCVSGGSIVGAHYYLEVRKLLQEKPDNQIDRKDYVEIVERLQRDFLAGVQRNIRTRVAGNLVANLRMAFSPTYSRTARAGDLFERELYARVDDGGGVERYINDLKIVPKGESSFRPKEQNWLRQNKVPMLVLNATTLNTGHNWQFTATWMGESPFSVDPEIDGNWRYRRMYYGEAPEKYRRIRLGTAVGASACVPGLFEPIAMPDLYPKEESGLPEMVVRLVDGGVHDNQGIASLLEQDCSAMFVSDASGQMTSEAEPRSGVLAPLLRSNGALMERVRQSQLRDLKARRRASLLKSLVIVHLKKGLEVDPVSWKRCKEPPDTPLHRRGDLLEYGVLRRIQKSLAAIRTDLDSFSEVEAYALMASGYLMTRQYAAGLRAFPQDEQLHEWDFLRMRDALQGNAPTEKQQDTVEKLLETGSRKAFKVWRLSPVLKVVAGVLALAAVAGFCWAWYRYPGFSLIEITIGDVGTFLAWTVAGLVLGKGTVALLRYRETMKKVVQDIAVAFLGFVAAQVHLRIFDPLFLRKGRIDKLVIGRRDSVTSDGRPAAR